MTSTLRDLWHDEAGFVLSAELILILTIAVLGMVVGLTCLRDAIGGEMKDIGQAFRSLDQGYFVTGFQGCRKANGRLTSYKAGSFYGNPRDRFQGGCEIVGGCVQGETWVAPGIEQPEVIHEPLIQEPAAPPCTTCPPATELPPVTTPPCDGCVPSEAPLEPVPQEQAPKTNADSI